MVSPNTTTPALLRRRGSPNASRGWAAALTVAGDGRTCPGVGLGRGARRRGKRRGTTWGARRRSRGTVLRPLHGRTRANYASRRNAPSSGRLHQRAGHRARYDPMASTFGVGLGTGLQPGFGAIDEILGGSPSGVISCVIWWLARQDGNLEPPHPESVASVRNVQIERARRPWSAFGTIRIPPVRGYGRGYTTA